MFESADISILKEIMKKFINENPHKLESIDYFGNIFLSRLSLDLEHDIDEILKEAKLNIIDMHGKATSGQLQKNTPKLMRLIQKANDEKHTFSRLFYTVFAEYFLFEYFATKQSRSSLGKKVQIYQMH